MSSIIQLTVGKLQVNDPWKVLMSSKLFAVLPDLVSWSPFSLSFLPSPTPPFVTVSFHMHHNQKASSQLNIESNWSHPHVTFGTRGLVWCTLILFDLDRLFQSTWTQSESFPTSFPASTQPCAFCRHRHGLFSVETIIECLYYISYIPL